MKKVLLTSAAVLALFAAAAPAVADINGGANTPGAYDQPTTGGGVNDAYNAQTEFENARKVNEYLAGHQEDIDAEAAQDPAVVAAKSEFDAVEGGSHLYKSDDELIDDMIKSIAKDAGLSADLVLNTDSDSYWLQSVKVW